MTLLVFQVALQGSVGLKNMKQRHKQSSTTVSHAVDDF
jgi:hypothetical protein